ncbi:MAG: hypothetical protein FJ027_11365 [Candidatus Rokubacteria bacterium]|nr:hypothetical protein [Candidatus Rokubacteria bacterium]
MSADRGYVEENAAQRARLKACVSRASDRPRAGDRGGGGPARRRPHEIEALLTR